MPNFIVMAALTFITLIVSLFNLGGHSAPETGWQPESVGESVTIELGHDTDIARFYYYCGINSRSGDGSRFTISARNLVGIFVPVSSFTKNNVNIWKFVKLQVRTSAIKLSTDIPGGRLNEIALVEKGKEAAIAGLRVIGNSSPKTQLANPEYLIDEQSAFEYAPSFKTGFYFDEIYHARTAWEQLHKIEPYETTHPPLGKLFISLGIAIFGMNAFGWRIVGVLFGVALVPLMYLFGIKLFRDPFYAFCASFLIMVDFMRFTHSRIAVIDVYAVFFILLMYYYILDLFVKSTEQEPRNTNNSILFAGAAFGIGAACKWIVLYAGCGIGLLVIFRTILDVKNKIDFPEKGTVVFLIHRCAICIVAFVIIPAAIYLLAYLPFMNLQGSGHDLADVFKMQKFMFTYHKTLHATHPFSSPWWSWPFDLRPIWMYMGTGLPSGTASSIVSFGNPAIWWLSIPAIFATLLIALKNRDSALKVVLIALAFQYLPWVGINRLTFIYHFFSVIPFVILCIVAVIKDMNLRFHDIRAYFLVTGGFFIIYYPVLSGMNISSRYIDKLKLFPSWLF